MPSTWLGCCFPSIIKSCFICDADACLKFNGISFLRAYDPVDVVVIFTPVRCMSEGSYAFYMSYRHKFRRHRHYIRSLLSWWTEGGHRCCSIGRPRLICIKTRSRCCGSRCRRQNLWLNAIDEACELMQRSSLASLSWSFELTMPYGSQKHQHVLKFNTSVKFDT